MFSCFVTEMQVVSGSGSAQNSYRKRGRLAGVPYCWISYSFLQMFPV